jgi:hypothetical protein
MQLMAEKTRMIRVADVQLSKRIATCIIWGEKLKVEEEANDFTRF